MLALNGIPASTVQARSQKSRPWHAMWFLKHIFQTLNAWSITQYNHGQILYNHILYVYGWVNYNDLTATSLGIMVNKGNHPNMALIIPTL